MDSSALMPLRLNGLTVDLRRGAVESAAGTILTLRPQTAEVLKVLAARPGLLVSKDELVKTVWGDISVTDDSLVQCITEIRKALRDEKHEIVRTVVKRGYVLVLSGGAANAEGSGVQTQRPWFGLVAGLAGIVVLGVASYFWLGGNAEATPPAIAVLPFENINGDERWDRFAAGVAEDIVTDLARYRDIQVIARSSTEIYRGKTHDVRAIGDALNVKYVLAGSLQVDGHRLRITAQLIDTETGAHIWLERYDRQAVELLNVQDDITEKIGVTLTGWQGQLTGLERARAMRKTPANLDAYDYWLLGIEAKHRLTPGSQIEARAWFDKGLTLAPDFMPLVRDMGLTYSIDMEIGSAVDFPAWAAAQRKFIEAAYALDPNDATVNFQMGAVSSIAGDAERGSQYHERALQLAPNNADVLMQMAWGWGAQAPEEAIKLIERTLKLNPRYPSWWNYPVTVSYFAARRFDLAYAAAGRFGESPTQAAFLAMSAAQLGKTREASDAAATVLRLRPDWSAESMFPYPSFREEAVLTESAAMAGLPVCMTAQQLATFTGVVRFERCEAERAKAAAVN